MHPFPYSPTILLVNRVYRLKVYPIFPDDAFCLGALQGQSLGAGLPEDGTSEYLVRMQYTS